MRLRYLLIAAALVLAAPLAAYAQSGNQAALDAANAELASAQEDLTAAQAQEGNASVNFGQLSAGRTSAHEANWRAQEDIRRQISDATNDGTIAVLKAQLQGLIGADAAADKALSDAQWALTSAQSAVEQARARIARAQAQIAALQGAPSTPSSPATTTTTTSTTPAATGGHHTTADQSDDELRYRALAAVIFMELVDPNDGDALTHMFLDGLTGEGPLGGFASAPEHTAAPPATGTGAAALGAVGTAAAVGAVTRGAITRGPVQSNLAPTALPPGNNFRGNRNWRSGSGSSSSGGSGKKSASNSGPSGHHKRVQGSGSSQNSSGMSGMSYVNRFPGSGGGSGGQSGRRRNFGFR